MHTWTIEQPAADCAAADRLNPVRREGSLDVIRTIGGVQAPAAGPWEIGSGQGLSLTASGLRTRVLPARTLRGALIVTDDLLDSSLDFTVVVPDMRVGVRFSTRVTRLLSDDSWQADGTTTTGSDSHSVSLRLGYNGVFCQRGRQPSLWLTIQATVDLPELGHAIGSRRARGLKFDAELNLNPRGAAARSEQRASSAN